MKKHYFALQIKKLLFVALALFYVALYPQYSGEDRPAAFDCGTVIDPNTYLVDPFYGNNQALVDILLDHNVAISETYLQDLENGDEMPFMVEERTTKEQVYHIPIKVWIYRRSNGTGNFSTSNIYTMIENVNNTFASNTGIRFYLMCDISEINNTAIAENAALHFNSVTLNNKVAGAINVHFFISGADWAGRANFPILFDMGPIDPIPNPVAYTCAINISEGNVFSLSNTLAHEIGHTLGLYHTHHPGRNSSVQKNEDCGDCYQEAVSRSKKQGLLCISTVGKKKCEVNGDFLCDTAADPFLYDRVNSLCVYTYGGTDNWGDAWNPNTNNIMSYSYNTCRTYFSPLQVAKMYSFIGGIGIGHPPFNISGPNYMCQGQTETFSVPVLPGVSNYTWTVPPGLNILSGQGTNSITAQATTYAVGGTISVTTNCGSPGSQRTLYKPNYTPISGPEEVCVYHVGTAYSTTQIPGVTYNWTITNGTILTGQGTRQVTVSLNPHSSNQSLIQVTTGMCGGSGGGALYIQHTPPGPDCQGEIIPDGKAKETEPQKTMLLYPNPAKGTVNIIAPDNDVYDIVLFNAIGQALYRKNEAVMNGTHTLDIQSYDEGIYFVYLIGKNKTFSKRLILKQ